VVFLATFFSPLGLLAFLVVGFFATVVVPAGFATAFFFSFFFKVSPSLYEDFI